MVPLGLVAGRSIWKALGCWSPSTLDLGVSYMAVFSLRKFIRLDNQDVCLSYTYVTLH